MNSNYRAIWATNWSQRALIIFILVVAIATFAAAIGYASSATGPDGAEAVAANAEASLGVYVNNYESDAGSARALMQTAGAKWTRLAVDWSTVEPSKGDTYDWSYYDAILTDMNAKGYQVIISLLSYPDWALDSAGSICGPVPSDYWGDFAAFAAAAVAHYRDFSGGGVIYYELGNEPDNQDPAYGWVYGCWGKGPDQDADGDPDNAGGDKYAGFMAAAYPAMKTAAGSSDIVVMMGGLAYDNFCCGPWAEGGPFDPYFLEDFVGADGDDYVDAINYHYFKAWSWRWGTIVGKGKHLQQVEFGSDLPLVVTEFGDPSDGPPTTTADLYPSTLAPGASSKPLVAAAGDYWSELSAKLAGTRPEAVTYSPYGQANYVIVGFTRGMSYGIQPMLWFQAVDRPDQAGGHYYGLLEETTLTPKLSYSAYETLAAELTGLAFNQTYNIPSDPSAEAYEFTGGGETRWVVWRNATTSLATNFPVGADNALRVVQKDGTEQIIIDGETGDLDGSANGIVRILIGPSPQILEPLDCTAASQITDVTPSISVDDVDLSWTTDANAVLYDIWRSDTEPYFEPDTGVDTPYDTDDAPPYPDVDALATPYPNQHFYLVTGQNVCGQSSELSNRTGAFQFVLVPGS